MDRLLGAAAVALLLCACSPDRVRVDVTSEVINAGYIGNGAEWDPYDEAESWGCEIGDADWEKLFRHLDFMRPGFVRCMINSPFSYFDGKGYDRERHSANLLRLLGYCQEKGIHVMYGEFNPPTWEMKDDQRWVNMSVGHLDWLVNEKGLSCIKEFVIFNEPDGNWASTNGDYGLWLSMARRFTGKMAEYPGLAGKVRLAAPDVVVNYRNDASPYDFTGWVERTAADFDEGTGLYDVHAYPGQRLVRSGEFAQTLRELRAKVPADKKIVLGEAGYKYFSDPADSLLAQEYRRRVEQCPFTRGSDCNMLCGDYFYGLDLPLLAMEVMNNGFSAVAVWMLDDAMHTNWDSGVPEDVKIWGFWNILGEEIFGDASLEEPKLPWYSWSLMCRYFPQGCDILRIAAGQGSDYRISAATKDGRTTVAIVNFGETDRRFKISLPVALVDGVKYIYGENGPERDADGLPAPVETGICGKKMALDVPAGSFVLISDMD